MVVSLAYYSLKYRARSFRIILEYFWDLDFDTSNCDALEQETALNIGQKPLQIVVFSSWSINSQSQFIHDKIFFPLFSLLHRRFLYRIHLSRERNTPFAGHGLKIDLYDVYNSATYDCVIILFILQDVIFNFKFLY